MRPLEIELGTEGVVRSHEHPPCKVVSLASRCSSTFSLSTLSIYTAPTAPTASLVQQLQWDTFAKRSEKSIRLLNERDFGVSLKKSSPKQRLPGEFRSIVLQHSNGFTYLPIDEVKGHG